jgi:hypothetical protein
MSDGTLLCGKRGSGKSLIAVSMIRDRLAKGSMVATNLNLRLDHLISPRNKVRPFRLPDWPTAPDFEQLPLGNPGLEIKEGQVYIGKTYKEENNGLLVLDEIATFINSRSWQAKDRQDLISWLLQSRKFGWDLLFLCQHPRLLDAQIRDSLFDLFGTVRRLDKVQMPFFGRIAALFGVRIRMPRIHIVALKYGFHEGAPVAERIWCRGVELFNCYDTTQKIDPAVGIPTGSGYQYLSGWDIRGKYLSWWQMNKMLVWTLFIGGLIFGVMSHKLATQLMPVTQAHMEEKTSQTVTASGYFKEGNAFRVMLSDGRMPLADVMRESANGWQARIGDTWYKGQQK